MGFARVSGDSLRLQLGFRCLVKQPVVLKSLIRNKILSWRSRVLPNYTVTSPRDKRGHLPFLNRVVATFHSTCCSLPDYRKAYSCPLPPPPSGSVAIVHYVVEITPPSGPLHLSSSPHPPFLTPENLSLLTYAIFYLLL